MATDYQGAGWDEEAPIIRARLQQWKVRTINIAVLGEMWSGKSSLINSLMGLTSDDDDGAKTGIRSTPQITRFYSHPKSVNVRFWEIEPYKSEDASSYLDRVLPQGVNMDIYILVSVGSFEGNDQRLGNEMKRRNYCPIFVRSKIDCEIMGACRSKPNTFLASQMVDEVRRQYLGENRVALHVFLVCNYKTNSVDFPALLCHLVDILPQTKRELLLYCLDGLVIGVGDKKVSYLLSRVEHMALLCVESQGCDQKECIMKVDMDMLAEEATFYYTQLGLIDASVTKLEHNLNLAHNLLTRPQYEMTPEFLQHQFLLSVGNSARTPDDQMGQNINSPLLASHHVYSSPKVSYKAAYQFLRDTLENFKKANNELIQQAERISNQQPPFTPFI